MQQCSVQCRCSASSVQPVVYRLQMKNMNVPICILMCLSELRFPIAYKILPVDENLPVQTFSSGILSLKFPCFESVLTISWRVWKIFPAALQLKKIYVWAAYQILLHVILYYYNRQCLVVKVSVWIRRTMVLQMKLRTYHFLMHHISNKQQITILSQM